MMGLRLRSNLILKKDRNTFALPRYFHIITRYLLIHIIHIDQLFCRQGDGTRAFYESLLKEVPNSVMANKWVLFVHSDPSVLT